MKEDTAVLYQLSEATAKQMMSYVLVNSEKQIAVIDGGNDGDGEALFRFLQQLGGERPVVEKWFLTHFHGDHINALTHILREHGDSLEIRAVYYHFPTPERALRESPEETFTVYGFEAARREFADRETILHTGDVIPFGSIRFKVLFMPDDAIQTDIVNNCSTALRCAVTLGCRGCCFWGILVRKSAASCYPCGPRRRCGRILFRWRITARAA